MAEEEKATDVQLLKRTTISVFVDEALPDILAVTYEFGVKIFKGVLLDSTKRHLPCGVATLHPVLDAPPAKTPDDDILYSANQRYAYTEPNYVKPKNIRIPTKYKNSKMTVRLRPRQVLCSKCKGICNENSENVSRKRQSETVPIHPPIKRGPNAPTTRSVYNSELKKKTDLELQPTLIPKISRLLPQEISDALKGNVNRDNGDDSANDEKSSNLINNNDIIQEEVTDSSNHSEEISSSANKDVKRILRKKRSVGSMEDLWDENVFEEGSVKVEPSSLLNTKTIKISYGPQGEGTVLKIPAKLEAICVSDDSEENVDMEMLKMKDGNTKASRRALKRARKEARRKILLTGSSPNYLGTASPRYTIGGLSPRNTIGNGSPRHYLGSNSPRYVSTSTQELYVVKKHKHKMKRKKKHREDKEKKHKEAEVSSTQGNIQTQRLSINLKRLNNTYTSCTSDKSEENASSSDEHNDQVPDFPPSIPPLLLRINSQTISNAPGADGGRLLVGDVVWGKIHGFPWWPGKILAITTGEAHGPQAHVAWYGSSTSSLIKCDQLSPYLENFKVRYNKKKRGPYKEAIKQATTEARDNAESLIKRDTIVNSPAHIIAVVPPALSSPREIDVVS